MTRQAAEQLLPLVYEELRKLAAAKLAQEKPAQTLQATAWSTRRTSDWWIEKVQQWKSRGHFLRPRRKLCGGSWWNMLGARPARKPEGTHRRVELSGVEPEWPGSHPDLLALNESLAKLEARDPRVAELVKLRFFVGMTNEQAAQSLGISATTAKTEWAYAKCWLRAELLNSPPTGSPLVVQRPQYISRYFSIFAAQSAASSRTDL